MKEICEKLTKKILKWAPNTHAARYSESDLGGKVACPNQGQFKDDATHILWMLEEIPKIYAEYERVYDLSCADDFPHTLNVTHNEKSHRWLGFVQGWMWSVGIVSINELREMNVND